MKAMEEKLRAEGKIVSSDIVKVESFLNHKVDTSFLFEATKEWHRLFAEEGVTKILTVESSGIALATLTALHFGVPVIFAKKTRSAGANEGYYTGSVVSYTHGQSYKVIVGKDYITPDDRVLIIDDFLANGSALRALIAIVDEARAKLVGAGIAVEKEFVGGGNRLRAAGYRIESLAKIAAMDEQSGEFKFAE